MTCCTRVETFCKNNTNTEFTIWGTTINHPCANTKTCFCGLQSNPPLCSIVSAIYSWVIAKQELRMQLLFSKWDLCQSIKFPVCQQQAFGRSAVCECFWLERMSERVLVSLTHSLTHTLTHTHTHTHTHERERERGRKTGADNTTMQSYHSLSIKEQVVFLTSFTGFLLCELSPAASFGTNAVCQTVTKEEVPGPIINTALYTLCLWSS